MLLWFWCEFRFWVFFPEQVFFQQAKEVVEDTQAGEFQVRKNTVLLSAGTAHLKITGVFLFWCFSQLRELLRGKEGFFLGIQTSTREPYYHKPIWLQPGKECKPELVLKYRTGASTEEWISPPGGAQSRAGPNSTWEQRKERRRRKNPYTMTKTEGTKRQITNIEKHQNLNRGTLMAGGHRKLETKVCNQTNKCRTTMTVNRDGLAANKYMGLSLYSVKDCSVSLHH